MQAAQTAFLVSFEDLRRISLQTPLPLHRTGHRLFPDSQILTCGPDHAVTFLLPELFPFPELFLFPQLFLFRKQGFLYLLLLLQMLLILQLLLLLHLLFLLQMLLLLQMLFLLQMPFLPKPPLLLRLSVPAGKYLPSPERYSADQPLFPGMSRLRSFLNDPAFFRNL